MGRILIAHMADSDHHRQRTLRLEMASEGHLITEAEDAHAVPEKCGNDAPDLVILDSGTDGAGACALCRRIRHTSGVGILVLFRKASGHSGTDALNAGADDYLSERWIPAELKARVRALLRRIGSADDKQRRFLLKDRAIDLSSHQIKGPGDLSTHLTPTEVLVLKCLMTRTDRPVNYRELAQTVWQRDGGGDLEYMRIVIGQLRRKIEPDCSSPRYILTERSVGYRFTVAADRSDSQAMAR
jgi:two-component system KDP operon response regulator KdpE